MDLMWTCLSMVNCRKMLILHVFQGSVQYPIILIIYLSRCLSEGSQLVIGVNQVMYITSVLIFYCHCQCLKSMTQLQSNISTYSTEKVTVIFALQLQFQYEDKDAYASFQANRRPVRKPVSLKVLQVPVYVSYLRDLFFLCIRKEETEHFETKNN